MPPDNEHGDPRRRDEASVQSAPVNGGEQSRSTTMPSSPNARASMFALPSTQPIKRLMKACIALLQPPAPLPTTNSMLLIRLMFSEALFADALGDAFIRAPPSVCMCPNDSASAPPSARSRDESDHTRCIVVDRTCALLAATQQVLLTEFNRAARDPGWTEDDYLLGTADRRLIRAMVDLAVRQLFLLVQRLLAGIREHKGEKLSPLRDLTYLLLDFCFITPAPAPATSQPDSSTSASASTHTTKWLPATFITDYLRSSGHVSRIFLAAILVGWLPTSPSDHNYELRKLVLRCIGSQPSMASTISDLAKARLIYANKATGPLASKGPGWEKLPWPRFVNARLTYLQAAMTGQPGGLRAFLRTLLTGMMERHSREKQISLIRDFINPHTQNPVAKEWDTAVITQACEIVTSDPPAPDAAAQDHPISPLHHSAAHILDTCYIKHRNITLGLLKSTFVEPLAVAPGPDVSGWLAQTAGVIHAFSIFSNSSLDRSRSLAAIMANTGYQTLFHHLEAVHKAAASLTTHPTETKGQDDEGEMLGRRAEGVRSILVRWMEVAQAEELMEALVDLSQTQSMATDESAAISGLERLHLSTPKAPVVNSATDHSTTPGDTLRRSSGIALLLELILEASCQTVIFSLLWLFHHGLAGTRQRRTLAVVEGLLRLDKDHKLFSSRETARPGDVLLDLQGRCALLELQGHTKTQIAEQATRIDRLLASYVECTADTPISDLLQALAQLKSDEAGTHREQALALLTRIVLHPSLPSLNPSEIDQILLTLAEPHTDEGEDKDGEHVREWTTVLLRYLELQAGSVREPDPKAGRGAGATSQ